MRLPLLSLYQQGQPLLKDGNMHQCTKLQMLYEMARHGFAIANQLPHVRRYDLEDDVALLLSKSDMLRSMSEFFVKDVAEKLLEARNGIALRRTVVYVQDAAGKNSAGFVVTTVDLHPSTKFTPDSTPQSPMVFDIFGETYNPGTHFHGKSSYYCVNEEAGDKLIVLAEQPPQP
jgi:hypothetical protein